MLAQIRASLNEMSASERKVAETVLANVQAVISWSLADAAKIAGVSEPTVLRFCRRLGIDGYSEFRLKFAQAVAVMVQTPPRDPNTSKDPIRSILAEACQRSIAAINDLTLDFDSAPVIAAVDVLTAARRVDIYGHGASGFLAGETQIRLARLGLLSTAYADPALQMFSSLSLTPSDAVLVLSFSGVTTYPMPNIEVARTAGAKVISMCPTGSPLAQAGDINIPINAFRQKSPFGFVPTERVALSVMIDVLINIISDQLGQQT
ncbi:MurR/RpiR family transcriptional regulator [Devosia epidermidihirudinis]|uniref:MurR/RpiR family transcriptional regulator n=1 Tax=Devosia epidermidihirudinis TaxID=1293439 RepID=UPI000A4A1596|nr:MurR/RpiR family transcriptional regulator [Devosia epidermidihirudinis]